MLVTVAMPFTVAQSTISTESPEPPIETDSPELLEALASARFEALNAHPLTGQAFTIEFVISLPPGLELVELPEFSDPWGDFELRSVSSLEANSQDDGTTVFRQQLEVVLWEPRDYVTPETFIGYRQTGFNDIQRLPVTPDNITVPTVLDFEDLTLRPYKPLVYLPYVSPWFILLGAVFIITLVFFIRRTWQRRPRRATLTAPLPGPAEIALWRLDELSSGQGMLSALRIIGAADTLRQYLNARFGIALQSSAATVNALEVDLPLTIRTELAALLQQADLLKFASGGSASALEADVYVERCQHWLRAVETNVTTHGGVYAPSEHNTGVVR
jgi:hypothetical protein